MPIDATFSTERSDEFILDLYYQVQFWGRRTYLYLSQIFVSHWDPPLLLLNYLLVLQNFSSISSHSRGQYWCCSEEDEISTPVDETASHREGGHSCTKINMDSAAIFSGLGQHISQCLSNLHANYLFVIFIWLIILPDYCLALLKLCLIKRIHHLSLFQVIPWVMN